MCLPPPRVFFRNDRFTAADQGGIFDDLIPNVSPLMTAQLPHMSCSLNMSLTTIFSVLGTRQTPIRSNAFPGPTSLREDLLCRSLLCARVLVGMAEQPVLEWIKVIDRMIDSLPDNHEVIPPDETEWLVSRPYCIPLFGVESNNTSPHTPCAVCAYRFLSNTRQSRADSTMEDERARHRPSSSSTARITSSSPVNQSSSPCMAPRPPETETQRRGPKRAIDTTVTHQVTTVLESATCSL